MKSYAPVLTLVVVAALGSGAVRGELAVRPGPADRRRPRPGGQQRPGRPGRPARRRPPPPTRRPPVVVEKAFAGRSSGNEVTVAVAVKDGRAVAYVCDGKKIEAWLEGTLVGDQLALPAQGPAPSPAPWTDTAALGSVAVDGQQWPYSAQGVQAPAGLYEGRASVRGVAARIGWIVEGDGPVTGVLHRRRGVRSRRRRRRWTRPRRARSTLDGRPVAVTAVGGDFAGCRDGG